MTYVCPECGHQDSPCWRSACWLKVATYCRIDELKVWEPDLAEKVSTLNIGETYSHKGMTYRLTRSGNVYRIVDVLASVYSSHGYTESPKHSKMKKALSVKHFSSYNSNQRRLLEEPTK